MLALAAHARNVTSKLFVGIQGLENTDSLSSSIEDYIR
jgi:hypothetical protein